MTPTIQEAIKIHILADKLKDCSTTLESLIRLRDVLQKGKQIEIQDQIATVGLELNSMAVELKEVSDGLTEPPEQGSLLA